MVFFNIILHFYGKFTQEAFLSGNYDGSNRVAAFVADRKQQFFAAEFFQSGLSGAAQGDLRLAGSIVQYFDIGEIAMRTDAAAQRLGTRLLCRPAPGIETRRIALLIGKRNLFFRQQTAVETL